MPIRSQAERGIAAARGSLRAHVYGEVVLPHGVPCEVVAGDIAVAANLGEVAELIRVVPDHRYDGLQESLQYG